jgi:Fe-S-cluster formation regulator IscX/YfhJ
MRRSITLPNTQRLLAELGESAAEKEAFGTARHHLGGQQSDQQDTNDPTDVVHTDDVQRIVVAEPEFRADRERADESCCQADDRGAESVHRSAGRGDRDQTGYHTRRSAERCRPGVTNPLH